MRALRLTERVAAKQLHPAELGRELGRRDIAYASFSVCGLILGGALVLNWIPTDTWLYIGLAWIYRRPILFILAIAAIVGGVFSILAWREWRLPLLSIATLLAVATPWLVAACSRLPDLLVGTYLLAYVLAAAGLPIWWLCVDRSRIRRRYPRAEDSGWLENE